MGSLRRRRRRCYTMLAAGDGGVSEFCGRNQYYMNPNSPQNKRQLIIIISAVETLISAIILLTLFGFFPIDISGLDIPRRTVGIVAGLWFASSLGILIYMLTKTDTSE